jgi:hypothetical protein
MAERPRYRPLGAAIPSIPTVDYAATGRAQARVFESVSRGLDVMARYVATQEEARTKREAAQWAYDQDITAEQLQAALDSGRSVDQILGDPSTVFGSVSVATTAQKLSTDLTSNARQALADLSARIDGGEDLDINKEMREISGMSAGYTDLLATLDPKVASSFSASVATLAAPVYQKGLERRIKMDQAVRKAGAEKSMSLLPNALQDIFKEDKGAYTTGSNFLASETTAKVLVKAVEGELLATNDAAFVAEQTGKIPAMIAEAKISALTGYVVELPTERRLSALRTGNLGDKTELFNTLDGAQKAEVRKRVRDEIIARQNADDQIRENNVQEARAASVTHVLSYISSPEGSVEFSFAKDALSAIAVNYPEVIDGQGIVALAKSKQTIQQPGYYEEENPSLVLELKTRIHNGQITSPEALRAEAKERGLGDKQTLSLFSYLETTQKRINDDVDTEARLHTRLVKGQIQVDATRAKSYNSFIANVERRFQNAVTEWQEDGETGPRPNKATIAKQYRLDLASSDYQKAIDQTLSTIVKKYPKLANIITEDTTASYIEDNKAALGLTDKDVEDIKRKLAAISRNITLRDELI